jgi:hypothetical protein
MGLRWSVGGMALFLMVACGGSSDGSGNKPEAGGSGAEQSDGGTPGAGGGAGGVADAGAGGSETGGGATGGEAQGSGARAGTAGQGNDGGSSSQNPFAAYPLWVETCAGDRQQASCGRCLDPKCVFCLYASPEEREAYNAEHASEDQCTTPNAVDCSVCSFPVSRCPVCAQQ